MRGKEIVPKQNKRDNLIPTTEECLEALASNPREADRVWEARLLGRRAYEEGLAEKAVPALIKWFDHQTMRDVAIEALGDIGPDAASAVESIALVAANDQERFISRSKAINALVKIGGPDHPFVAAAFGIGKADPDERVGLAIRQTLKTLINTNAICPAVAPGSQVGTATDSTLDEISGVAASLQNPGVFWAHNDSGDTNIDRDSVTIYRVLEPDVSVGQNPVTVTLSGVQALPRTIPAMA